MHNQSSNNCNVAHNHRHRSLRRHCRRCLALHVVITVKDNNDHNSPRASEPLK